MKVREGLRQVRERIEHALIIEGIRAAVTAKRTKFKHLYAITVVVEGRRFDEIAPRHKNSK